MNEKKIQLQWEAAGGKNKFAVKECRMYSQNGEDSVVVRLLNMLYSNFVGNEKYYVEIGAGDGGECNTHILRSHFEWQGLMIDNNNQNLEINLRQHLATSENIVGLMKQYGVPPKFNLLSIDIDFNDFYILREVVQEYKTDIIVLEYNATHLPTEDKVVLYDDKDGWRGTNYFGASLLAFYRLLSKFGYSLVYAERMGVNAFFVSNDIIESTNSIFPNINNVEAIYRLPRYGSGPNGGHNADPSNREYVSSYSIL